MIQPRLTTATRGRMQDAHWNWWSVLSFVLLFALMPLVPARVDAAMAAPEADERTPPRWITRKSGADAGAADE